MTPEIKQLIEPILIRFGVTEEEVISKTRKREIAYCRFFCMKEVKENTIYTLDSIGKMFGGRHHSSVIRALREAEYLTGHPYLTHLTQ
jgi:chromosomal replication initiation ATPase DnaA